MKITLQPLHLLHFLWRTFWICTVAVSGMIAVYAPVFAQTATPSRTPIPTVTPTRTPIPVEIFLPVIQGEEERGPSPLTGLPLEAINALVGQIHRATDRNFGNYLLTDDNLTYGLVGATVALEQKITTLRNQEPPIAVVVWGTSYAIVGAEDIPVIVVANIQSASATPVAPNVTLPIAVVKFDLVNLRAGPANSYARTGQVVLRQRCTVVGRDRLSTWWELACSETVKGWIDRRLVEVTGETATLPITEPTIIVVITPSPIPTATATRPPPTATVAPPPSNVWRASYFDNRNLQGQPLVVQEATTINFLWGANPPVAPLPADNFSARFERVVDFNDGFYRFSINADDGVRFWIDGKLVLDEWHGSTDLTYTVGRTLRGAHTLRIDYYEANGLASLRFLVEYVTAFPEWEASYFNGVNLGGSPVFTQLEARTVNPLDYEWESSSPLPELLGSDNWSARWVGQFRFNYATYVFRAIADDGVRVYLNNQLVLDGWRDGYNDVTNRFFGVGAGIHTIRVEYYERTGNESLRVWWYEDIANSPR